MEFSLLGAAAMGMFAFWAMLRWEAPRGNAAGCAVGLWDAGLTSAIVGLFVGRIMAMIAAGINPLTDPAQILLIRSGVSTPAVVIATSCTFAFLARRDLVTAADGIAPSALAGIAGWHAGCVTSRACLGTESDVPWAWALPGSDVTRHPVELYAVLVLVAGAVGLALWKQHGRPAPGVIAGLAITVASAARLATEPMRNSLDGGPVLLYSTGIVVGVGVVLVAWYADRRAVTPTTRPGDPAAP